MTKNSPNSISVIIPLYNEEVTIEELIARLKESLAGWDHEIIVVDDGSRDRSWLILETLAQREKFKILKHHFNLGKGAAIRTALSEVRGDITVIQDADLEYNPKDLISLITAMGRDNLSVVYGSRNLKRDNEFGYLPFLWGGKLLSFVATLLFHQKLTDINTGYKIFRTDLLRSLDLKSRRFEFCEEVTAKILRRGIIIRELPISYHPRKFSQGKKISFRDGITGLVTLLRYRF